MAVTPTRSDLVERLTLQALSTKSPNEFIELAVTFMLEEAAKIIEEKQYLLGINADEGPLTKTDRVCKETREQAAETLRSLK